MVQALSGAYSEIRLVQNTGRYGFGMAVRCGLHEATGDAVAIVMADGSDSPEDVVKCYRRLLEGSDCVFGSRFVPGSKVIDYPPHKLILNRLANWSIRMLFGVPFNEFTNAFKLYRREVLQGMQPLISPHFNLTVEMPLKAITRGYSFAVVPISWRNRQTGISNLKIKEMGSRYLFIVLYLWLERHLPRVIITGDTTPNSNRWGSTFTMYECMLITGGAGFVDQPRYCPYTAFPYVRIIVLNNLHRRGSELNLPRLARAGVRFGTGTFVHSKTCRYRYRKPLDLFSSVRQNPRSRQATEDRLSM